MTAFVVGRGFKVDLWLVVEPGTQPYTFGQLPPNEPHPVPFPRLPRFPKYFAFGTVVEGPQDFYGGRLDRAQRRKTTLTEQLLADSDVTHVGWFACACHRAKRSEAHDGHRHALWRLCWDASKGRGLPPQSLAKNGVTHLPCPTALPVLQSRKKRYTKLQDEATKYQKVKKRKTEQPREQRSKPKPKH